MTVVRVLPEPGVGYGVVREALVGAGWEWADEAPTLPIVAGEPEWVVYRHPAGGRLRYVFNPAVGLREIEAEGPAEVLAGLAAVPQVGPAEVEGWLGAGDVETVVRGVLAVRAVRWVELLPRVRELRAHPDELVRRVAADVDETVEG